MDIKETENSKRAAEHPTPSMITLNEGDPELQIEEQRLSDTRKRQDHEYGVCKRHAVDSKTQTG